MATLKDFESDKKEIISMVDSLNKICNLETNDNLESDIKFKLFILHKKVKETNETLDNILNVMSNIEPRSLAKLKDSLQDLIVKLERSVCVPEFCINSEIHSSCQYLTKKLIEHLQEITFCYDLSDMPRASNKGKGIPKKEKFRVNSLYKSVAPSESELIESAMRKKNLKCNRRRSKKKSSELTTVKASTLKANTVKPTVKRKGRFTISYPDISMANEGVGKKKKRTANSKKKTQLKKETQVKRKSKK